MFEACRPGAVGQRQREGQRTVDVQAEPVKKPDLTPIVRKEGDENSSAFWLQFVSGDDQRTITRETTNYVIKTIVCESVGPRYSNQPITFGTEPITVADVLAVIERLSGPAGWQHLQRKAGLA
jgi:hypothetical protein